MSLTLVTFMSSSSYDTSEAFCVSPTSHLRLQRGEPQNIECSILKKNIKQGAGEMSPLMTRFLCQHASIASLQSPEPTQTGRSLGLPDHLV